MDRKNELELEDERTAQKRYAQQLRDRALRPLSYQAPANTIYTQDALPKTQRLPVGQLIGRVALASSDPMLGGRSDFYIGEQHLNLDGIEVFSWAAPVACTYFRGTHHHDWCDDVTVVRSFVHRDGQIVDLADDIMRDDAPARPFPKRGLAIPDRQGPRRPLPSNRQKPATEVGDTETTEAPSSNTELADQAHAASTTRLESQVRAESLLRAQLQAPRTNSLAPVLSTLQPDQYELVTISAKKSVIIEGQPGTGKTIVASHRAAWMLNEEMMRETPEHGLDGNVLLLGPTDGYAAHVRNVVSRLSGESDRVQVMSMPTLMMHLVGRRGELTGPASRSWMDVDTELARLARTAIFYLRRDQGVTPTVAQTFEFLRLMGARERQPMARDDDWRAYLGALPPFERAIAYRAHAPLIAFIRWEVAPPVEFRRIDHIMVDEAQDVNALEWQLLTAINEGNAWTLLGDLNQRRSDHTLASWRQVCDILSPPAGDPPIVTLTRGYRSTKPILDYANRLLRRADRDIDAFQQNGPEPTVTRVPTNELTQRVLAEIARLRQTYPAGTCAVIAVEPGSVRTALRKSGWHAVKGNQGLWEKSGHQVVVVHPDTARGLEFDAVIVVEPAAFPQNFGRQGPLYTALTRPNRELAVVHSRPLPDALKVRKR